jgi:hypothetical protein
VIEDISKDHADWACRNWVSNRIYPEVSNIIQAILAASWQAERRKQTKIVR